LQDAPQVGGFHLKESARRAGRGRSDGKRLAMLPRTAGRCRDKSIRHSERSIQFREGFNAILASWAPQASRELSSAQGERFIGVVSAWMTHDLES